MILSCDLLNPKHANAFSACALARQRLNAAPESARGRSGLGQLVSELRLYRYKQRLVRHALVTLPMAHDQGKPWLGLPLVMMRGFHHAALRTRLNSQVHTLADLPGKPIGVRRIRKRPEFGCPEVDLRVCHFT
jgi:hypothetical protein